MHPAPVQVLGVSLAIWNLFLLIAIAIGYVVLRLAFRSSESSARPRWLFAMWLVTVYVGAVGAQLFAYAFDLNTSLLPPEGFSAARYYLDPLAGPKTLYGAVLTLPVSMLLFTRPWSWQRYGELLACWTPAMMATLAVTRVGCLLQGCCYGQRDDALGIVFPVGSPAYWHQVQEHLIAPGMLPLPVIPTQLLEAIGLAALCAWGLRWLRRGRAHLFAHGVALYSALRILLEVVRDDPERNHLWTLSTSQWIAFAILGIYVAWAWTSRQSTRLAGSPSRL